MKTSPTNSCESFGGLSPHRSGPRQRADCECAADLARGHRAGRGPAAGDHRVQTNHSGGSSSELWVLPCSLFNGEPWGSKVTPKRRKDMGIEWKSEQDVTNNLGESERAHHKVTTNGLLASGCTSNLTELSQVDDLLQASQPQQNSSNNQRERD